MSSSGNPPNAGQLWAYTHPRSGSLGAWRSTGRPLDQIMPSTTFSWFGEDDLNLPINLELWDEASRLWTELHKLYPVLTHTPTSPYVPPIWTCLSLILVFKGT